MEILRFVMIAICVVYLFVKLGESIVIKRNKDTIAGREFLKNHGLLEE